MQLNKYLLITLVLLISLSSVAQKNKRDKPIDESSYRKHINLNWAKHTVWDDGLAEVAVYQASQRIYNKARNYECVYITVKEVFNGTYNVKTDDYSRADLFDVLKVNRFERIETDQYPYHYLSSMFFKRDAPMKLHKMTINSQEWCGNTFKAYTPFEDGYRINYNSYWDGEGQGEKIQKGDFLFEDQLPFTLRMMNLQEGLSFNARLMPTQISAKVGPIYADLARFRVKSTNYSFNENEIEAWKVVVQLDLERANIYIIEKANPNRLLSIKTWDQRSLKLKEVKRYAYWK